jgi:hypothetical protein
MEDPLTEKEISCDVMWSECKTDWRTSWYLSARHYYCITERVGLKKHASVQTDRTERAGRPPSIVRSRSSALG